MPDTSVVVDEVKKRRAERSPVGSWEYADFLRKCKLGNITAEETEKKKTNKKLPTYHWKKENNEGLK